MARDDKFFGADVVSYKVRMISNIWWLMLFNDRGKAVSQYGPMTHDEVPAAQKLALDHGLTNLERDVIGDRPTK